MMMMMIRNKPSTSSSLLARLLAKQQRRRLSGSTASTNHNITIGNNARRFQPQQQLSLSSTTTKSPSSSFVLMRNHHHGPSSFREQRIISTTNNNNKSLLSSLAVEEEEDDYEDHHEDDENDENTTIPAPMSREEETIEEHHHHHKHCRTCTCEEVEEENSDSSSTTFPCGQSKDQHTSHPHQKPLPPPLPEPTYSVHRRVLPERLVALRSERGRQWLMESLNNRTAESYWSLTEQFANQSDPAYCGLTTLLVVLNALSVDPHVRWRGGWRFYGSEDMLLSRCCLSKERIQRNGISMEEFVQLGKCQGLHVIMRRPSCVNVENKSEEEEEESVVKPQLQQHYFTVQQFRQDLRDILSRQNDNHHTKNNGILVVSYSRSALGQTGEGHFSPIAAYHEASDRVLVLDVARFKYAPYWAPVEDLYSAMMPVDAATQQSRGWFLLYSSQSKNLDDMSEEERRPAHLVRRYEEEDICPVGKIKVEYCAAAAAAAPAESSSRQARQPEWNSKE